MTFVAVSTHPIYPGKWALASNAFAGTTFCSEHELEVDDGLAAVAHTGTDAVRAV